MEAWLKTTFPIVGSDGVSLLVYSSGSMSIFFNPADVSATFPGIVSPPSYAALSALSATSSGNWQIVFDDWKAQGLVS